jgi:dephospho-CoA kinase
MAGFDHKQCLRVGITGGIGSGKSTVARMFAALGVPVYDADYWARWLIQHDASLRQKIVELLGPNAYDASGAYDRAYVAGIVFHDKEKLAGLNALVHPAVELHGRQWHEEQCHTGVPYTLKEAALLIESGSYRHLDALIVVTAPEPLRIRRVMQRDGVPAEAVQARIRNQMPEAEKAALADFVIVNDGAHLLAPQVWEVHRALWGRINPEGST